jgi:hypothetical protein
LDAVEPSCGEAENMATPLLICYQGRPESRASPLWAEDVEGVEIYIRFYAQYTENAVTRRSVYECIDTFKEGGTSVTDSESSKLLSVATSELNKNKPEP